MKDDIAVIEDEDGAINGDAQQEIIDEEELSYLKRMKDLKKNYRDNYEQLRSLRGEVFYI